MRIAVYSFAFAAAAAMLVAASDAALADTCRNISGTYGPKATAALILGPDGKTLHGEMGNGARPNFYGTCVNGKIEVKITDDPNPAAGRGTFDGMTISWENNTNWVKNAHN